MHGRARRLEAVKLDVRCYDVAVLDRDLRGINGDTLCQMITKRDDRAMAFILVTASPPKTGATAWVSVPMTT